jgi:hypothetical protein
VAATLAEVAESSVITASVLKEICPHERMDAEECATYLKPITNKNWETIATISPSTTSPCGESYTSAYRQTLFMRC